LEKFLLPVHLADAPAVSAFNAKAWPIKRTFRMVGVALEKVDLVDGIGAIYRARVGRTVAGAGKTHQLCCWLSRPATHNLWEIMFAGGRSLQAIG
jgi:hypothetical protein